MRSAVRICPAAPRKTLESQRFKGFLFALTRIPPPKNPYKNPYGNEKKPDRRDFLPGFCYAFSWFLRASRTV